MNDGWIGLQKIICESKRVEIMGRLQDKVAIISGGAKNQGAAEEARDAHEL